MIHFSNYCRSSLLFAMQDHLRVRMQDIVYKHSVPSTRTLLQLLHVRLLRTPVRAISSAETMQAMHNLYTGRRNKAGGFARFDPHLTLQPQITFPRKSVAGSSTIDRTYKGCCAWTSAGH